MFALAPAAHALPLEALKRMESGEISSSVMQPAPPAPPEIREHSSERALKVGNALSGRRAIMFGTYWCPYCDRERQSLGKEVFEASPGHAQPLVRYVECEPTGASAEPGLCQQAGIKSYPTWAFSAKTSEGPPFELHNGFKGLRGLERLLGTTSPPDIPPPVTTKSGAKELAVAKLLKSSGALFYGTWWCPACDEQRQLFGKEAWALVPYVECGVGGIGEEPAKCNAAGVNEIPYWVFPDGTKISNLLSLDDLEARALKAKQGGGSSPRTSVILTMPTEGERCEDCKLQGS